MLHLHPCFLLSSHSVLTTVKSNLHNTEIMRGQLHRSALRICMLNSTGKFLPQWTNELQVHPLLSTVARQSLCNCRNSRSIFRRKKEKIKWRGGGGGGGGQATHLMKQWKDCSIQLCINISQTFYSQLLDIKVQVSTSQGISKLHL